MQKTKILLYIAAATSVVFPLMVESFNGLSQDDIGFALLLQNKSILEFIHEMYFTWQGRYTMFLVSGLQIKSYFLFGHMLPFSLLLYGLNIFLLAISLRRFFNLQLADSFLFSFILFHLFVYTFFDFSSYFWLCTKPYTLQMILTVFGASELFKSKLNPKLSFLILFFVSIFVGASYEIFAPLVLLVLGVILLVKFYQKKFQILSLLKTEKKLVFVFIVTTLAFFIMVIAPGNWVRMDVHAPFSGLTAFDFLKTTALNTTQLAKYMVLRAHYLILFAAFIYFLSLKNHKRTLQTEKRFKSILLPALISGISGLILIVVSVLLNTYAIGPRMELRAFNHVNLIFFIVIGFWILLYTEVSKNNRISNILLSLASIFLIVINTYAIFNNHNELKLYSESRTERMIFLESLKAAENTETIRLEELHTPIFRSVDDFWKILVPNLTPRAILKPNEVSYDVNHIFNVNYRQYYGLDFGVVTTLSFDLE